MGWSGNATGNANPLSVVMNGPKNITATFADVLAPVVNVTVPNGGQVWGPGPTSRSSGPRPTPAASATWTSPTR